MGRVDAYLQSLLTWTEFDHLALLQANLFGGINKQILFLTIMNDQRFLAFSTWQRWNS